MAALTLVMACSEESAAQPSPEPATATAKAPAATVAEATAAPKEGAQTATPVLTTVEPAAKETAPAQATAPAANQTWTANQLAANGPLPGDVTIYETELACAEKLTTPGYYQSINGVEIADAERSGRFPCATFTGSFDGPNKVYAWRSEDDYQDTAYINNRMPGELYLVGGVFPPLTGTVPAGPFIAKANATTGKEIWRTYFDNANVSGTWIGSTNLNILPNGNIVHAWSNKIALLDGDTGVILRTNTLPAGDTPIADVNFKHLTISPDGTLIIKDQTRPTGFPGQGTLAIIEGVLKGFKQGNSHLVAVDPNTLEVLEDIPMPEPATVPHIVIMFEGKIAIYVAMDTTARRYFWNPVAKKLVPSRDRA